MGRKTLMYDLRRIPFNIICDYWVEVDHFKDPNKRIVEVIKTLGPHTTTYTNPKRISYGLYDGSRMIGATQLVQWSDDFVRYRTLNIRKEYRNQNLGWELLETAWNADWKECSTHLFGWIRDTHYDWAIAHDFIDYDADWSDSHIAMIRKMK